MNGNLFAATIAFAALMFAGCGGTTEHAGNRSGAAANAPASANRGDAAAVAGEGAAITASQNQSAPAGDGGGRSAQSANAPQPQIGSGGNDFYLFTQARAALSADAELKAANLVVEVKDGVATLTGAVADAEQRAKAERIVAATEGVKSVRNQIKVSAGK